MFTVKATYCGETRKLPFPALNSFPSYDELCAQLYRVFDISNDHLLYRLLFSPDANSDARLLIGLRVRSQEGYDNCVRQFADKTYSNALLRFNVFDEGAQDIPNSSSNISLSSDTDVTMESNNNNKRPLGPSKFEHFQYISSLSHTPSIKRARRSNELRPIPQEVPARQVDGPSQPQRSASTSSAEPCCSVSRSKSEIDQLVANFQKDLQEALSTVPSTPSTTMTPMEDVTTNNVINNQVPTKCPSCKFYLGRTHEVCEACSKIVCQPCIFSLPYDPCPKGGRHDWKTRLTPALPRPSFGPVEDNSHWASWHPIHNHHHRRTSSTGRARNTEAVSLCLTCKYPLDRTHYACETCHKRLCHSCYKSDVHGDCSLGSYLHNFKLKDTPMDIRFRQRPFDLANLFADGSFPSAAPARFSRPPLSFPPRINRVPSTSVRSIPVATERQNSTPCDGDRAIHTGVLCDSCQKTIVGVRHKCLDCPDYDLCDDCIKTGGAERHNPFHEFFDVHTPGQVIVHTVFSGEGERQSTTPTVAPPRATAPATPTPVSQTQTSVTAPQPSSTRVVHYATCDLCDSRITGDRYKCFDCPDFDTCSSCFAITPEQHPGHSFVKMRSPDDYYSRHASTRSLAHYATCNVCSKLIHGVRYKCMHPDCPDYDLCHVCEAHPIPLHPPSHPLLKMKTLDTVVPTVYRVGGTNLIDLEQAPQHVQIQTKEQDERPETPKAMVAEQIDSHPVDPFQDPMDTPVRAQTPVDRSPSPVQQGFPEPPIIAPITGISSLVSSFEATINATRQNLGRISYPELPIPVPASVPNAILVAAGFGSPKPAASSDSFFGNSRREDTTAEPSFSADLMEQTKLFSDKNDSQVPISTVNAQDDNQLPEVAQFNEDIKPALLSQQHSFISLKEEAQNDTPVVAIPIPIPPPQSPVVPKLGATFVADVTIPDGQVFPPGAEFVKCWRMLNSGPVDWPEGTEFMFVGGDSLAVDRVAEVMKIGSVKSGQEVDVYTSDLKAPEAPGRYVGYWRLRDDQGKVFGDSLWFEIEVAEAEISSPENGTISLSGSSILTMPHVGSVQASSAVAPSVREVQSVATGTTLTAPSTTSVGDNDDDFNDDDGSDVSLIDLESSDDEDGLAWQDARSHVTQSTVASSLAAVRDALNAPRVSSPFSAGGSDFVVLYEDDSSDGGM